MEERSFTETWVTDELKMAMRKGYVVDTVYEVWHVEHVEQYDPRSKSGGIFTDYINTFLKMKQKLADGQVGVLPKNIDRRIFETTLRKKAFYLTILK
jgi:hypothetical protein